MTNTPQSMSEEETMKELGFTWDSFQSCWRNDGKKQYGRDYDDSISSDLARQITQYSLTKQLEARVDELENRLRVQFIPSHWERLRNETNSWAKYVDRRIDELKHQIALRGKENTNHDQE